MNSRFIHIVFLLQFTALLTQAQTVNVNWQTELTNSLHQFMQCDSSIDDISPYNIFVGESLKVVYKINDFYSENKGQYRLANEIYDFLEQPDKWTLLGSGDDQNTLDNAQGNTNLKKGCGSRV